MRSQSVCSEKTISRCRRTPITFRPSLRRLQFDCSSRRLNASLHDNGKVNRICRLFGDATDVSPFPKLSRSDREDLFYSNESSSDKMKKSKETDDNLDSDQPFFIKSRLFDVEPLVKRCIECSNNLTGFEKPEIVLHPEKDCFETLHQDTTVLFADQSISQSAPCRGKKFLEKSFLTNTDMKDVVLKYPHFNDSPVKHLEKCFDQANSLLQPCKDNHLFNEQNHGANEKWVKNHSHERTPRSRGVMGRRVTPVLVEDFIKSQVKDKCKLLNMTSKYVTNSFCLFYKTLVKRLYDILLKETNDGIPESNTNLEAPFVLYSKLVYKSFEKLVNKLKQADIQLIPMKHKISTLQENTQLNEYYVEDCIVTVCCPYDHVENDTTLCEMYRWAFLLVMFYRLHISSCACFLSEITEPNQFFSVTILTNILWGLCHSVKGRILLLKGTCQIVNDLAKALNVLKTMDNTSSELPLQWFYEHCETCLHETVLSIISFIKSSPDQLVYRFHTQRIVDLTEPICYVCTKEKRETMGKNSKSLRKPIVSLNTPYENLLDHLSIFLNTSMVYPYQCCILLLFCSQIHWLLLFYLESRLACELESLIQYCVWCFQNVCNFLQSTQHEDLVIPDMGILLNQLYTDKKLYKFFTQSYNHFYCHQTKENLNQCTDLSPQDFLSHSLLSNWKHVSFGKWQHDKNVINSIIEMACNLLIVSGMWQKLYQPNFLISCYDKQNHTQEFYTPFSSGSSVCIRNCHAPHTALSLHTCLQSFLFYVCVFCTCCFYTQRHCFVSGEAHSVLRLGVSMSKIYQQCLRNYLKYVEGASKLSIKRPTLFSSSQISLTYQIVHESCFRLKSVRKKASVASHSTKNRTHHFSVHSAQNSLKAYFKIKTPQLMTIQNKLITFMLNLGDLKETTFLESTFSTTVERHSKFLSKTTLKSMDRVLSAREDSFEKQPKTSVLQSLVYFTHSVCSATHIYESYTRTLKAYTHQSTPNQKRIIRQKTPLKKLKRKHKKNVEIHLETSPVTFAHGTPTQKAGSVIQCCPCMLWLLTYCDIKYNQKDCWQHSTQVSVEPDSEASVEPDSEASVEADSEASVEADSEASVKREFNHSKSISWTLCDASLCSNGFFNPENKCHSKKNFNKWRHLISKEKAIPWDIAVHCLRFIYEREGALHTFSTQDTVWIEIVSSSECPLDFLYQPLLEKEKNVKRMNYQLTDREGFVYLPLNKSFLKVLIFFEALCALSRVTSHMTAGQTFCYTIQVVPHATKRNTKLLKRSPTSMRLLLTKSQWNPFFVALYDNTATSSLRTLKSTLLYLLNQEIMTESRIIAEKANESLILLRTLLVDVLSSFLCISLKRSLIQNQNVCDQASFGLLRSVMKLFQFRKAYLFVSPNASKNRSTHGENPMCFMAHGSKRKPCLNDSSSTTWTNTTRPLASSNSLIIPWCVITLVHFLRCVANVEVEPFASDAAHFIADSLLSFFPTSPLASEKYFSFYTQKKQKHERVCKSGVSWISLARNKLLEIHEKEFQCDWNLTAFNGFKKFWHPSIHPCSFFQNPTILAAYLYFENHELPMDKTTLACHSILTFFPVLQLSIFSIPFDKLFIFVSRIISRIGRYLIQFSDIQWTVLCSLIIHSVWTRLQKTQDVTLEILCTFLSTCSLPFIATEDPFQITYQSRDVHNLWVEFSTSHASSTRTTQNNLRCVYFQLWMASLFHLLKLLQNVVSWVVSQNVWFNETNHQYNHLLQNMQCVSTYYRKQLQKCVVFKQYLCDHNIDLQRHKLFKNNCFSICLADLYTLYNSLIQMFKEANGNHAVRDTSTDIIFKRGSIDPHVLADSSIPNVYQTLQCIKAKQQQQSSPNVQTSIKQDRSWSNMSQNVMKIDQESHQDSLSHQASCSVPPYVSRASLNNSPPNFLKWLHTPASDSSSITLQSDSEDFYETQVENKCLQEQETNGNDLNEWVVYDQMDLNVVQNFHHSPAKKFIPNDLNNYSLDPLWSVYITDMFCNSLHE